ncbi:uncharacterized protein LOC124349769 isoform X3 [Daphnia pulicaria]|uniref:uncharacterized protein LOC124349769 isoform X3 n=1 Tax=Daphnia pulicaria TaxID=35523 RepID=UPI001EEC4B62|nr:uncharacterized protein LOC124349769 isoform X3 [Daphnia pulicaria]
MANLRFDSVAISWRYMIGGNNFPRSVDFISRGSNAELDEFTTDAAHGVVYHGVRLSKEHPTADRIVPGSNPDAPSSSPVGMHHRRLSRDAERGIGPRRWQQPRLDRSANWKEHQLQQCLAVSTR